jgi:hypothetical protein
MSNCETHRKDIGGIKDMSKIAELIGELHYKTLTELFVALAAKIKADSEKDFEKGRHILALQLEVVADKIDDAAEELVRVWEICKPFIKE